MAQLSPQLLPGQHLRQTQEQVLSLLAQQRLKLLPLPLPELRRELRQRAEQNPFLEYAEPPREVSLEALVEPAFEHADQTDNLDYFNASLEGFGDQADPASMAEAERRYNYRLLSQTEPETLYRHLERQILEQFAPSHQRDLLLFLCDALDGDGYLRQSTADLLADWWELWQGTPPQELADERAIRSAIQTVQTLDPVGVGARSLAECLELQVRADLSYRVNRALYLRLCHRLGSLLTEPRERLARTLRCTPEELKEALAYLGTLNPFPGRAFAAPEALETPEVVALWEDGRWKAVCDERRFPLFRVDEARVAQAKEALKSAEERRCVSELEGQARLMVDAYHERNETLRKVAQATFDHQAAFLSSGGDPSTLRPLLQKTIAEAVGYDESIISRTIKDKAVRVETSRKLLPLKAFFTHALPAATQAEGAEAVSDQQAKSALRALVEAENRAKPLSDQAIMEALAKQGIVLARRTVAKYREQLGIPSTRERRQRP